MTTPLLRVHELVKHYSSGGRLFAAKRPPVRAVDGISFAIAKGETLALVGESGSGKSTVGRAVLRLEVPTAGTVHFEGHELGALDAAALRQLRRRMQIVFQDPYASLNPRRTVGDSIAEGLVIHEMAKGAALAERVEALLTEVGLDPSYSTRYPHEFSGGQRQRIGIARALAVEPSFIVCDEPVSALDVSVQAQVLNLLLDLRARRDLAYLFISHDLAVVRQIAHRVAVMYHGTLVEIGPARSVISTPRHPYTQALVSAVPSTDATTGRTRIVLEGDPPSPSTPLPGCPFAPRCFHASKDARCTAERPSLRVIDEREVACHHA